mgnify:CR=1 FL=1
MKNTVLMLGLALSVAAAAAHAETMVEDTDGTGTYSYEEMMVAYPDMTEDTFAEIDTDESEDVTVDELAAAIEAGLIEG